MRDLTQIEGPIVVIGVGGFIGAHLLSRLKNERTDVTGLTTSLPAWRTEALGIEGVVVSTSRREVLEVLKDIRPRTIFNLAAHGAYHFQVDMEKMWDVNFRLVHDIAEWAAQEDCAVVQAGSSSEYGWNSHAPSSGSELQPNSLYAVTKGSASQWLEHMCKSSSLNAVTLRLYSVYGPLEDPSRLFPTIIRAAEDGNFPPFANAATTRDFIYIDDVIDAFLSAGVRVRGDASGHSISICSGKPTTMVELSEVVAQNFGIQESPVFGSMTRKWDLAEWFGDPEQASELLDWRAKTSLAQGLSATADWYQSGSNAQYLATGLSTDSRQISESSELHLQNLDSKESVKISGIVACYKDGQAIWPLYERFKKTMTDLGLNFELIFVNDASPDDSLTVLEGLTSTDSRVIAVTHSRNFGSQAAFLSGMRKSTGDYVVLMDGDLQDPPELIAEMWEKSKEGYDVVFGHRVDREAPWIMRHAYKAFYRVFDTLSPFKIPRNAGDFSLMSRHVVEVITEMTERDLFIRAERAYVGFRQTGVDYVRPERMFGKSTNSLGRNLGWATRGVLAVSRAPLTGLSVFSLILVGLVGAAIVLQLGAKILFPDIAPEGLTSLSVLILGMGALNLLAISIVGEYVGRILEETKRRPRYVTNSITQDGITRNARERNGEERGY